MPAFYRLLLTILPMLGGVPSCGAGAAKASCLHTLRPSRSRTYYANSACQILVSPPCRTLLLRDLWLLAFTGVRARAGGPTTPTHPPTPPSPTHPTTYHCAPLFISGITAVFSSYSVMPRWRGTVMPAAFPSGRWRGVRR